MANRRASDAKGGKRKSVFHKAAERAFERHEEAWFNFHRYDTDDSGTIDVNELGHLLSDLKMHVARASRSEEQMHAWVKAEVKKHDANGDGVLSFEEFLGYYNKFVARHRSQCDELYEVSTQELGRGAFGVVVRGTHLEDNKSVAMKRLVKAEFSDKETLALLHNEIAVWEALHHPHLVLLMDVFEEPEHLILITELMRGGDLLQRLDHAPDKRFPDAIASRLSAQLVAAVAYASATGFQHARLPVGKPCPA